MQTEQDGIERRESKDVFGWKQGGRKRRRRCYNFVFHGCGTSHPTSFRSVLRTKLYLNDSKAIIRKILLNRKEASS
ncbi:hypothetical protein ACFX1W_009745 [Malus domestica]